MNDELGHYAALGLPPGTPAPLVHARFRALAKRLHPDVHGGDIRHEEQFRRVRDAYKFLADARRKADYDARPLADPNAPAIDTPPPLPASPWVPTGAARPAPRPAPRPPTTPTRRRSRRTLRRMTRTLIPASLTWALVAATLFLLGAMFRTTPANAHHTAPRSAAPRRHAARSIPASETPPPAPGGLPTDRYRAWTPPSALHDTPDVPDPVLDPMYQPHSQYQVDSRYTTIDPRSTGVDPAYTAVDHQAISIDPHITAIDPRNTGIDPRLTSP